MQSIKDGSCYIVNDIKPSKFKAVRSGTACAAMAVKSVQSTLNRLITTSVPRAMLTYFLVKYG